MSVDDRYRVQSVGRAFAALEALALAGPEGMTASEVGRAVGVSKSTAFAMLQTMLSHGAVADSGAGMSRRYRLGMALARLGDLAVGQVGLREVAMPVLRDLTAETGLTSRVAVLDGSHAMVVGQVDASAGRIRFVAELGRRERLHCSAVGKAMLAMQPLDDVRRTGAGGLPRRTERTITDPAALARELDEVARLGYAMDDEEDVEGIFCVGAAVVDRTGGCVGAISVSGLKLDQPAWRLHRLGETVRGHADRVSTLLGATPGGRRGEEA